MSGTLAVILIISILVIYATVDILHSNKLKREALAAKPADNRIYKVFCIDIDGKPYHVVKNYQFYYPNQYSWNLVLDYSEYKDMTKDKVIELCDIFNEMHLEDLHKKKMTRLLENTQGNIIH